jgi:hypothetical protein
MSVSGTRKRLRPAHLRGIAAGGPSVVRAALGKATTAGTPPTTEATPTRTRLTGMKGVPVMLQPHHQPAAGRPSARALTSWMANC